MIGVLKEERDDVEMVANFFLNFYTFLLFVLDISF